MAGSDVLDRMREDWNRRAEEDAHYYVAFGQRDQDEAGFLATATDAVRSLVPDLDRLPAATMGARRALEIGCGPGRLMLPMSRYFGEIHGVDVADGMIRIARERLRHIPNAHAHHTTGADLAPFADESFDFVYSYAVFQHIPSRDVVFSYLRECRRVLKPGGILRCQINGLPASAAAPNTWEGVRIPGAEVAAFARENDFQLLALENSGTQYMWTTWRKRPEGWCAALTAPQKPPARLRVFGNAHTGEPVLPASGRYANVSFWLEGMPEECDLNGLAVSFEGAPAGVSYVGPPVWDGVSQLNAALPAGLRTGVVPVELRWLGQWLCAPAWVRVIPPGPAVPVLCSVADGVNLASGTRISSRMVKLTLEEIAQPERLSVTVDSAAAEGLEWFEVDASIERFEVNFRLPDTIASGRHEIVVRVGRRAMGPVAIEVA